MFVSIFLAEDTVIHIGLVWRVKVSQRRAKVPVDLELNINICAFVPKMLNIETPLSQGSYGVATLEIHRFEHNWKDRISVTQCLTSQKKKGGSTLNLTTLVLWVKNAGQPEMQHICHCPFLIFYFPNVPAKSDIQYLLMLIYYEINIEWDFIDFGIFNCYFHLFVPRANIC